MIHSPQILKTKVKYYLVVMTSIETRSIKINDKKCCVEQNSVCLSLVLGIHIIGSAKEDSCDRNMNLYVGQQMELNSTMIVRALFTAQNISEFFTEM